MDGMQLLRCFLILEILSLALISPGLADEDSTAITAIGQALFFDTNLSQTRHQACGTCHEPGKAFSDGRDNNVAGSVSLGDDGASLGDRNTPSIAYANQIPEFHISASGDFVGGFFLDGRSATMADQAGEPFLNPIEMGLPDRAAVIARVRENAGYVRSLQAHFGDDVFADDEKAFAAVVESIVTFERSDLFSPFDSKYDRYLRGDYELSSEEELGRLLFFSQLISCHGCHLLDVREGGAEEMFTNHKYHNIGVPANNAVRLANGRHGIDQGLLANPAVDDPAHAGKFRVPSLRNVAVTGPYMHNGVFQDLETAILFYDKYIVENQRSGRNPETGERWEDPEIPETVDLELLQQGQPITERRVSALVAFLRTLTDLRYEPLLDK